MLSCPKRHKHVPERTCIACRQKKAKWELVRIVRTPQGGLEIDHRGKKTGRGTYLCKKRECWDIGLKKNKIGNALKIQIAPEQCAELGEYGRGLTNTGRGQEVSV
jgi:predicted RNA-binding protein YlxR (DUF448 family)